MLRERTEKILNKYGIRLSKKRGQSHLVDGEVLKRIVDYGDVSSTDRVLEIGPGIGNLTSFLLRKAGSVIAVEKDRMLVDALRDRMGDEKNLEIVHGDVLEVDLPSVDKVVANLPYSVSSPVTFRILEQSFELAVLMYQKEFAERMVAKPGTSQYSRLSVNVSYRSHVELLEEVSPDKFIPQPDVSSAIVKLVPKRPDFEVRDDEVFFKTVRAAFQHRRKKIRNSLIYSLEEMFPDSDLSDDRKRNLIDEAIPEGLADRRAQELSPEKFGIISNLLLEKRGSVD
ncbi:hypothetical protein AKJ61_00640 [candidate division MSBL1 archaeon SCGC-AAA259B11]|uniref:Probable ribosomal RNA small subunit methyltransferase A n=1 Tax=candidate division MSBL1 archaeon SCGC-AAA259B11 TaxID=1698260 RepID=A0A133U895_9EURY|nr:hypothetical protein AKJ61_00640 [candidate division MSBL1 archaeon SCGC-AAA259B11]